MSTAAEAQAAIQKLDQSDFKDRTLRISPELSKKRAKAITRERRRLNAKKLKKES
jgi:RNA recognition motif-containing protein